MGRRGEYVHGEEVVAGLRFGVRSQNIKEERTHPDRPRDTHSEKKRERGSTGQKQSAVERGGGRLSTHSRVFMRPDDKPEVCLERNSHTCGGGRSRLGLAAWLALSYHRGGNKNGHTVDASRSTIPPTTKIRPPPHEISYIVLDGGWRER